MTVMGGAVPRVEVVRGDDGEGVRVGVVASGGATVNSEDVARAARFNCERALTLFCPRSD